MMVIYMNKQEKAKVRLGNFKKEILNVLSVFCTLIIRSVGAIVFVGALYFSKNFSVATFSVDVQNLFFSCCMFAGLMLLLSDVKLDKKGV